MQHAQLKFEKRKLNPENKTVFSILKIEKGTQWHNVIEMNAARRGTKPRKTS